MIRDGDIDPEHIGDRTKKTFGLTQRMVGRQAKRGAGLDGDRRIDWLAAPLSSRRRMPWRHRLLGEPHRRDSASDQRGIVFRLVRHPVSRLGKLVASAFGELVRHEFSQPALSVGRPILRSGRQPHHPSGIDRGAHRPALRQRQGPPIIPAVEKIDPSTAPSVVAGLRRP